MASSIVKTSSSADMTIRQDTADKPESSGDFVEEYLTYISFDEPVGEVGRSEDQELCNHRDEDTGGIHELWAQLRALIEGNRQLRHENASLRAELREVRDRVSDMSAALAGNSDAMARVCHRVSLEDRRNKLVNLVTRGRYPDWVSYVSKVPEDSNAYTIGKSLQLLAEAIIPDLEGRARFQTPQAPQPAVQSGSVWKSVAKRRSRGAKREKETAEAEQARRIQEAQEAQAALDLLRDQELWKFVMDGCDFADTSRS